MAAEKIKIRKSVDDLKKLNTKRLLSYYKAEFKRMIAWRESHYTGFEYSWHLYTECEHLLDELNEWEKYLDFIKSELNTREHITR